jgi:hypothetical protein
MTFFVTFKENTLKNFAENFSSIHTLIGSFSGMRHKFWFFGKTDPLPRRSVPQTPSNIFPPETAKIFRNSAAACKDDLYAKLASTQIGSESLASGQ